MLTKELFTDMDVAIEASLLPISEEPVATAYLVCEGRCFAHVYREDGPPAGTPIHRPHEFVRRRYGVDSVEFIYACLACGGERVYGNIG